jgi:hypothetical protein
LCYCGAQLDGRGECEQPFHSNLSNHHRHYRYLVIISATASALSILSWVGKPFPGFVLYTPPYVGAMSLPDWPGIQAGLKFLDRIVAVDGRPVSSGPEIVSMVRRLEVGTPVTYTVESQGRVQEIVVPTARYGLRDLLQAARIPCMCGVILTVFGVVVVILKPNITTSWIFLAFTRALGVSPVYAEKPFSIATGCASSYQALEYIL